MKHQRISGASHGILASFIANYSEKDENIIFVSPSHADMKNQKKILDFFAPNITKILLPGFDTLPYDRVSPSSEIIAERIYSLKSIGRNLKEGNKFILITTADAVIQKIRHPDILQKSSVIVAPNKRVSIEKLSRFLSLNGYLRTQTVRDPREFSVRGGIIDIFPSGMKKPIRLDFFGDVIERIKIFDPITQISEEEISSFDLSPAAEIILNKNVIENFKQSYRILNGGIIKGEDNFYEKIISGTPVQGMEAFLPLFDSNLTNILELIPDADIFMDYNSDAALEEFIKDVYDYYNHRISHQKVVAPEELYLSGDIYKNHNLYQASLHNLPIEKDVIDLKAKPAPNFAAARKMPNVNLFDEAIKVIKKAQSENKKILITSRSDGAREILMETLSEHGLPAGEKIDSFGDIKYNDIYFAVIPLANGFEKDDILCLSQEDIFGAKSGRTRKKNKKADIILVESQGFTKDDYIVHSENGIGCYKGLEVVAVNGVSHDCVLLEYYGGDRLYIPVENIDLLTRYGAAGTSANLDKLGGASWQSRKSKLKKRLTDIADHLIKIAAERHLQKGEVIQPIEDLYRDFCARFPYEETEDQLSAIEAVISDMASGSPMDRLICGDVGFGKTEVAIRAAFMAAAAGIQTAIIVPTTLLSRQHFTNFKQRFEGQPFKVETLSRMVSAKKADKVREGLKDGTVDIVIGTHALLSSKVVFKNLGLLVIDEEQHFGVTHKEKLKNLKSNIHILTLTATPIPRTLQLSMTGVRDLSLIATPPVDRLAIRTYVSVFDKDLIREALLREKYRGGQAFFVVPRVADIEQVSAYLEEYVNEISFITAHGKLSPGDLDQRMNDFYDRKYDVLVATTIIESGIDIPTANTMVVWRSDMFGLAQLYQIRGRIGRSKQKSYAYLTTQKAFLTDTAQKRLKVLESLDHLGAGFTLASHDMDIRGTGNLLGSEQSGHIREVGFELYQQMLEEALAKLRNNGEDTHLNDDNKSPQINIGISAMIPENYVSDLQVRFGLYRRLAELDGRKDIDDFAAELTDRFGKIPSEVRNLLSIIELKSLCKKAHVSKLDAGDKGLLFTFHNNHFPKADKLLIWVESKKSKAKIRPDHRLVITASMPKVIDKFKHSVKFLKELSEL